MSEQPHLKLLHDELVAMDMAQFWPWWKGLAFASAVGVTMDEPRVLLRDNRAGADYIMTIRVSLAVAAEVALQLACRRQPMPASLWHLERGAGPDGVLVALPAVSLIGVMGAMI